MNKQHDFTKGDASRQQTSPPGFREAFDELSENLEHATQLANVLDHLMWEQSTEFSREMALVKVTCEKLAAVQTDLDAVWDAARPNLTEGKKPNDRTNQGV